MMEIMTINLSYSDIVIGISGLLYLSVAIFNACKGDWPWSFLWLCYSLANFALVVIALKK